ncbi:MAG TPA: hypothetical protein VK400_16950 [Pyrinomonadaceae bacterium]|nr:hypothetical protein [Pyrinomonadaceae bacterium]
MKFDKGIRKKYRQSIEAAFETILDKGDDFHRWMIENIVESEMLVCVFPVSKVNASGITGVINPRETNEKIESEILSAREALGEVFITIAEETIDTGGQRGCEGTFVHEGRHAFDFAQTIASFSDTAVNPLSLYDPTLYELEWEAHKTAGDYMLQINRDEYLREGLDLMILARDDAGRCFVSDEGIRRRLRESYGLEEHGNRGNSVSQMFGLRHR